MAIKYKSNIDLGGLQLQHATLHPVNAAPTAITNEGQVYWNTTDDKLYVYNGSSWIDVSGDVRQIDAGTGISVSGGSGGTATVSLSHLGLESLTAISSESADEIFMYDASAQTAAYLSVNTASGITIDSANNDLKLASIPNSSLANSSLTVTAGNGLTDGGSISLGGSATVNVGAGTGISVTADAVALKNAGNLTDTAIPMWDDDGGQLTDSSITDDGTNVNVGADGNTRNLVVSGNLTVEGTTTTIDSNTVNIGDNILVLNADETGSASQDAGIEIERGTDDNKKFYWDETNNIWRTEGGLWIGTADAPTGVTTQTKVLIQNTGTSQKVERIDIADIGTALGVGSHSILLDAVNRDNVSKSGNVFTVTHGLGSKLVNVQILDATTYETVFVEVARPTADTVTVSFADTVANGDYICMTSLVGALDTSSIAS